MRIDRHHAEYVLVQTLWVLFRSRFTRPLRRFLAAFEAQAILDAWQHLPASVLRAERNKRQHLSSVLSRNEVARDYAYNRQLYFRRVDQGWYQFNPQLSVRRRVRGEGVEAGEVESWVPVFQALNLPLVAEFARRETWRMVDEYGAAAKLAPCPTPIMFERTVARGGGRAGAGGSLAPGRSVAAPGDRGAREAPKPMRRRGRRRGARRRRRRSRSSASAARSRRAARRGGRQMPKQM